MRAVERKECLDCEREFKCCAESRIDLTVEDAVRILDYLDKSIRHYDEYFDIYMSNAGKYRGLRIKQKVVRKVKDSFGYEYEVKCCIFFDTKKRLCKVHKVKPSLCAAHICLNVYHDYTDKQYKQLEKERRDKGLTNESRIRYDSVELIREIVRECLKNNKDYDAKKYKDFIKKFEDFHYDIQEILGLEDDYDDYD